MNMGKNFSSYWAVQILVCYFAKIVNCFKGNCCQVFLAVIYVYYYIITVYIN